MKDIRKLSEKKTTASFKERYIAVDMKDKVWRTRKEFKSEWTEYDS